MRLNQNAWLLAALTFSITIILSDFANAQAAGSVDPNSVLAGYFLMFLIGAVIYFIPSTVAFWRGHPNRWVILAINFLFGGTGIGWIGALIWAFNGVHRSPVGSNGGESGLNIFVNDPQIVKITSDPTPPVDIDRIADRLLRLKNLFDTGAINEVEFAAMRAAILKTV